MYRLGQLVNVFLLGVLVGVSLIAAVRQVDARPPARRPAVRVWRTAPVQLARGIDAAPIGCWAPAVRARSLGW